MRIGNMVKNEKAPPDLEEMIRMPWWKGHSRFVHTLLSSELLTWDPLCTFKGLMLPRAIPRMKTYYAS